MEAVMNDPVYKGRFSVDIVYIKEKHAHEAGNVKKKRNLYNFHTHKKEEVGF